MRFSWRSLDAATLRHCQPRDLRAQSVALAPLSFVRVVALPHRPAPRRLRRSSAMPTLAFCARTMVALLVLVRAGRLVGTCARASVASRVTLFARPFVVILVRRRCCLRCSAVLARGGRAVLVSLRAGWADMGLVADDLRLGRGVRGSASCDTSLLNCRSRGRGHAARVRGRREGHAEGEALDTEVAGAPLQHFHHPHIHAQGICVQQQYQDRRALHSFAWGLRVAPKEARVPHDALPNASLSRHCRRRGCHCRSKFAPERWRRFEAVRWGACGWAIFRISLKSSQPMARASLEAAVQPLGEETGRTRWTLFCDEVLVPRLSMRLAPAHPPHCRVVQRRMPVTSPT